MGQFLWHKLDESEDFPADDRSLNYSLNIGIEELIKKREGLKN